MNMNEDEKQQLAEHRKLMFILWVLLVISIIAMYLNFTLDW